MSQEFTTFDLNLASTLVSLGFELLELDRTADPRKVRFVFRQDSELGKSVENYWANNLTVSPQELFNAQKLLKNRIYSDF
ncbi:MAG: DUF5659 domain-containing protein [Parcubacteria group bacterium]